MPSRVTLTKMGLVSISLSRKCLRRPRGDASTSRPKTGKSRPLGRIPGPVTEGPGPRLPSTRTWKGSTGRLVPETKTSSFGEPPKIKVVPGKTPLSSPVRGSWSRPFSLGRGGRYVLRRMEVYIKSKDPTPRPMTSLSLRGTLFLETVPSTRTVVRLGWFPRPRTVGRPVVGQPVFRGVGRGPPGTRETGTPLVTLTPEESGGGETGRTRPQGSIQGPPWSLLPLPPRWGSSLLTPFSLGFPGTSTRPPSPRPIVRWMWGRRGQK